MTEPLRTIAVIGGGSAGWMSAAFLAAVTQGKVRIVLVESEEIGTVGVGEATIPPIKHFNALIGLDEQAFTVATQGSYKLGIEFVDWGRKGERYMHAFGPIGQAWGALSCHQYWLADREREGGPSLEDLTINTGIARADRFTPPQPDKPKSPLSKVAYAYHFDAGLYAKFLRAHSEARGVERIEGKIVDVRRGERPDHIAAVVLGSGRTVEADFFIDCSGFRGLLIEGALKAGWESWKHWLPCDRAVAAPSKTPPPLTPYTRSTAVEAGWIWRIPLRHRTGNGLVYSSAHLDDEAAKRQLVAACEGEVLAEPRVIRFEPGRRKRAWIGNCLAVGLAGGFLEPLESTSIHMVQTALFRFAVLMPERGIDPVLVEEFNRLWIKEYEQVRDFIILHYKLNQRDEPLWRTCREMAVPDSLQRKIDLFAATGHVERESDELFFEESWVQVMLGQNLAPRAPHPMTALKSPAEIAGFLDQIAQVNARCVQTLPTHDAYLAALVARAEAKPHPVPA